MIESVRVAVEVLPHGAGLALPRFETEGSAGADIRAAVHEPLAVPPGRAMLVPTGLKVAVPRGYEIQVRPRSGLALKKQVILPNSPGTIDSDYRGELQIIVMNLGAEEWIIQRGDRIAQLVLARVRQIEWQVVESVDETARGSGGFGHTGVR